MNNHPFIPWIEIEIDLEILYSSIPHTLPILDSKSFLCHDFKYNHEMW